MIAAGIRPGTPDTREREARHIGTWIQACDLRPGMHVQDADGRWGVVGGVPVLAPLGRVAVPVWLPYHFVVDAAADVEPEWWAWGWRRLAWCRTPEQMRQYVAAVEAEAEQKEGNRGY